MCACGAAYLLDPPTPESIGDYYDNVSGAAMQTSPGALFRAMRDRRIAADLAPLLERLEPDVAVADVGTGDGSVADWLHRHGRAAVGLDVYGPDGWTHPTIPYRQVSFDRAGLTPDVLAAAGPVGGAVMRHVLEHVHRPAETLGQLRAAGLTHVLIVVPNVRSRMVRRLGSHWYYWDPPRHLTFFSADSLTRCAVRAGFRVAYLRTYGLDELVTSAHRALLGSGRPGVARVARALRPTGLIAGGASVLQARVSDTVVHAVLEADDG